jgi:hypothetical protein
MQLGLPSALCLSGFLSGMLHTVIIIRMRVKRPSFHHSNNVRRKTKIINFALHSAT